MKQILFYAAAVVVLIAAAKLLTFVKPYKVALVKRVAATMEKRYVAIEKSGARKKCRALRVLRWLLIKADEGTSLMIDAVIAVAKEKQIDMVAALKTVTAAEVTAKLSDLQDKLSKEAELPLDSGRE